MRRLDDRRRSGESTDDLRSHQRAGVLRGHPGAQHHRSERCVDTAESATPRDVAQAPTALLADRPTHRSVCPGQAPTREQWRSGHGLPRPDRHCVGGPYRRSPTAHRHRPATITGLVNGATYYFRVAAVNEVGDGAWSTSEIATPYTGAERAVDHARPSRRSTHCRHHTRLRRRKRHDRLRVPARCRRVMEVDRFDDDRLRHRQSHQRNLL